MGRSRGRPDRRRFVAKGVWLPCRLMVAGPGEGCQRAAPAGVQRGGSPGLATFTGRLRACRQLPRSAPGTRQHPRTTRRRRTAAGDRTRLRRQPSGALEGAPARTSTAGAAAPASAPAGGRAAPAFRPQRSRCRRGYQSVAPRPGGGARPAAPRQPGSLGRPARRVGALRATARRRVHRPNNARVAIAADALDNFVAGVLSDAFFSQDPVDRPFLRNEAARRAGW